MVWAHTLAVHLNFHQVDSGNHLHFKKLKWMTMGPLQQKTWGRYPSHQVWREHQQFKIVEAQYHLDQTVVITSLSIISQIYTLLE